MHLGTAIQHNFLFLHLDAINSVVAFARITSRYQSTSRQRELESPGPSVLCQDATTPVQIPQNMSLTPSRWAEFWVEVPPSARSGSVPRQASSLSTANTTAPSSLSPPPPASKSPQRQQPFVTAGSARATTKPTSRAQLTASEGSPKLNASRMGTDASQQTNASGSRVQAKGKGNEEEGAIGARADTAQSASLKREWSSLDASFPTSLQDNEGIAPPAQKKRKPGNSGLVYCHQGKPISSSPSPSRRADAFAHAHTRPPRPRSSQDDSPPLHPLQSGHQKSCILILYLYQDQQMQRHVLREVLDHSLRRRRGQGQAGRQRG
jgi:hypothetical protein